MRIQTLTVAMLSLCLAAGCSPTLSDFKLANPSTSTANQNSTSNSISISTTGSTQATSKLPAPSPTVSASASPTSSTASSSTSASTPASVQLTSAGSGCDDGYCLWVTGTGFTSSNMTVTVLDSNWNALNTYSGSQLAINTTSQPQSLTLPLATATEKQALLSAGLIATVSNGQTFNSISIASEAIHIKATGTGCSDGNCLWINGTGFTATGTVVMVKDSNWNLLNTYSGSQLAITTTGQPQSITLALASAAEKQDLSQAGLIVTVSHDSTWDSHSVTANSSTVYANSIATQSTCSLPSPAASSAFHQSTVSYVHHSDGQIENLDVLYPTSGNGPFPLLILVHGGGWNSGDKSYFEEEQKGYEAQNLISLGYAVAAVNYRVSNFTYRGTNYPNMFPAAIQDVRCAVQYLRSNAGQYHIDSSKVGIAGQSAGGQIASLVGVLGTQPGGTNWDSGDCTYSGQSQTLQAVAAFYGVFDFTDFNVNSVSSTTMISTAFTDYLGGLYGASSAVNAQFAAASPVNYLNSSLPPFFLTNGDQDQVVPYPQSGEMANDLFAHGVPRTYVSIPGAPHAFNMFGPDSSQPPAPTSTVPNYEPSQCTFIKFLQQSL